MTFLLRDPGWYVHKPDVQNKWDDNTHTLRKICFDHVTAHAPTFGFSREMTSYISHSIFTSSLRFPIWCLLLLLDFISCEGHLSLGSLLPTSAVPCLLCASLLLGTSISCPLPLLHDFLNTRLLAIPNFFPRTLRRPLFSRASSWSRGSVGGHGTERHPRLRRRSIRRVEALNLFYTTVPRALKSGTTRLTNKRPPQIPPSVTPWPNLGTTQAIICRPPLEHV